MTLPPNWACTVTFGFCFSKMALTSLNGTASVPAANIVKTVGSAVCAPETAIEALTRMPHVPSASRIARFMIDLFWEEADLPSKSLLAIIGAPETTLHIVALRQPDAQLRMSLRRKEKAPVGQLDR